MQNTQIPKQSNPLGMQLFSCHLCALLVPQLIGYVEFPILTLFGAQFFPNE
jgi:hypothetical protein